MKKIIILILIGFSLSLDAWSVNNPMKELLPGDMALYYINGNPATRENFEKLKAQLIIDKASRYDMEKDAGGYTGFKVRHNNTQSEGEYLEGMEKGITIYKINLLPIDDAPRKKGLEKTSQWNTYTDPEKNFSFKYPRNWKIVQLKMDDSIVEVQPTDTRDPYARINSFRVVPFDESEPHSMSDGATEWQGGLGEGDSFRQTRFVPFLEIGVYVVMSAQPLQKAQLDMILASFTF